MLDPHENEYREDHGMAGIAPRLILHTPIIEASADSTLVTFPISSPDGPFDLRYDIIGAQAAFDATPAIAAVLLPALRKHWAIEVEAPVSARVMAALPTIQDILTNWDERNTRVDIQPHSVIAPARDTAATGVGVFFSGGVDSFYSLVKHTKTITHLIFIVGFDVPIENQQLRSQVTESIRTAARELGLPLIEVQTNLREFADRYAQWELYHGAALVSVGLLLRGSLGALYVPASDTYADIVPWGSHPLLDPLWSAETLEIIHDGCEATRVAKTALIAQNAVALKTLRVCWRNLDGAYNCGRCEKCLRTMVALESLGALGRCQTFAIPLDLRRVAALRLGDNTILALWKQNHKAVKQQGTNPALERAVRTAMKRPSQLRLLARRVRKLYRKISGRQ